jgi:hypothetical protein
MPGEGHDPSTSRCLIRESERCDFFLNLTLDFLDYESGALYR